MDSLAAGRPQQADFDAMPQHGVGRLRHWRSADRTRSGQQPFVKARQRNRLSTGAQEFDRCQMEGIKRPDGDRKWVQGASEDRRGKFDQRHTADQGSRLLAVRAPQPSRVNTVPDLIFRRRFETRVSRQMDSCGDRSSTKRYAGTTELSR
jgi:hypothetical protein